jgi:hypothetical protein
MESKKQTAVEWLVEQIMARKLYTKEMLKEFEQALEMEKQQMFEFWNGGIDCTEERGKSFEQYYKETYETQE